MKNIEQLFRDYIKNEDLFKPADKLLVAVSGGVDSVVLCHLCYRSGLNFSIAHCHFNLRGVESDADAAFVKALASTYAVTYFEKHFDTEKYAEAKKLSIQVAARDLRYAWFHELLENKTSKPFNYLLTAHHADDNVETVLMNFFKGTGINGLKGILPRHGKIVRPLLFAKKEQLLAYAAEYELPYRQDSSNATDKYTRNFFRNSLIPSLEKIFPAVTENLVANADRFREIQILYNHSITVFSKKLVFKKGEELHIPVLQLQKTPASKTVLFEIIKGYGFTAAQTNDVLGLLHSETGKYVNSSSHRIYRYNKWLILSGMQSAMADSFLIEEADAKIFAAGFSLEISRQGMPAVLDKNKEVAMLDPNNISYPLILRKWKRGDYFYPLGMLKKKKLGRFLSDEKLSLTAKENTWVIESGKKIIWVVGIRIDDRFKVTDKTKMLLKINRLAAK